jgi:hypothetical protein
MIRFAFYAVIKLLAVPVAFIINPILPLFGQIEPGWVNNRGGKGYELYLPDWLYWFSTNYDNSLWGDEAHRVRHPNFTSYWAMVCWLYRNPAKGIDWTLLGAPIDQNIITKTDTGYRMGEYFLIIKPNNIKFGWEIDAYAPGRKVTEDKAAFVLGR